MPERFLDSSTPQPEAFTRQTQIRSSHNLDQPPWTAHLGRLAELCRTGQLTPIIDARYPLEAAADAIRHMETTHTTGKVIVTVP